MDETTKWIIIIALLIIMTIMVVIQLAAYMRKKKMRKDKHIESISEEAHNKILTAERISVVLRRKGIDVSQPDSLLREARRFESAREYYPAMDKCEEAREILMRLRRDSEMQTYRPEPEIKEEVDLMSAPVNEPDYEEPEPLMSPAQQQDAMDKLPAYYMQSKFMLSTVGDLIEGKKGPEAAKAQKLHDEAQDNFNNENYSKALSLAIKAEQLLDKDGGVGLIAETPHDEEVVEADVVDEEAGEVTESDELDCHSCGAGVTTDDAFCRKCGEKMEFQFVCPKCEEEVGSDDLFCRKCGEKLH